jgi:hypothetical protein
VGTIGLVPTTFKAGDAAFTVTNPTATSNGTAVTGTWAYASSNTALLTVSGNTMTILAAGSVTITGTFTPTAATPAVFTTATATRSITIAAAGGAITPTLSAITYTPSPLTPTTTSFTITNPSALDGATPVTGTFTYTSSNAAVFTITGTTANVVAPGTALINVSFVPTDPKYATTTASLSVTVPPVAGVQSPPPPVQTPTPGVNAAAIVTTPAAASYSAISTVKLSVPSAGTARTVFTTSTAGCKIIGTDLTAAGALTCHVVANILTTPAQSAATDITFTLANQESLRISNTVSTTARGNTLILKISGGSGSGAVTYSFVSDNGATCSVTNGVLTSATAGKCSVTATKAASSIYNSVSSLPKEFIFN